MKTVTLVILLTAVALFIAFTVRATRQIAEAEMAMATLMPQRTALRAEIAKLEKQRRSVDDRLARTAQINAKTPHEREGAGMAAVDSGNEMAAKPNKPVPQLSPETVIANDPSKLAEYSKDFRDSLDLIYGGMFKALHLSSDQIEKFKDLKVWLEQRRMDLRAAVETQGVDQLGETYAQLNREHSKVSFQKETEVFGNGPLMKQYQEYKRLDYLRDTTRRLASSEVYPEVPITSAVVERVTEIVANNSQRKPGASWSWQLWPTINWDAASAQLQGVLSPSQLATLRLFVREGEAQTAVAKRNIEVGAEAKKISRQPGN